MSSNDAILIRKVFRNEGIMFDGVIFEIRRITCVDNYTGDITELWPLIGTAFDLETALKFAKTLRSEYGLQTEGI